MAYQVLARKWRPRDFASLVGQDHVVRALSHALDHDRLHHAYLLTGTRGVGKTTLARIMAKSVNCETGISSHPCGTCRACVEIDEARFVDYLELDAASNRGVDEMTQLLENAVYAPSAGRFKVYVIDEVHMLSNHAFNAMLKTLEEPPAHVLFVLATTDPQRVPMTVLSRCMQLSLRNMTPALIAGHLAQILELESISAEAPALALIGKAASGSMRDALSLLDQAIAVGGGQVEERAVREMLGVVDRQDLERLLEALVADDGAALIGLADEMHAANAPFERTLGELASMLQRIAVAAVVPSADDEPDAELITGLAGRIAPEDLQAWYQIAIHGRRDLLLAPDALTGFSMTLLRLLAFRMAPADGPGSAASSSHGAPRAGSGGARTPAGQARPGGEAVRSADENPARAALAAVRQITGARPGARPRRAEPARSPAVPPVRQQAEAEGGAALQSATTQAEAPQAEAPQAEPPQAGPPQAGPPSSTGVSSDPASDAGPEPPWPDWLDEAPLAEEGSSAARRPASPPSASHEGPPAGQHGAASGPTTATAPTFDGDWPGLAGVIGVSGIAREFMQQSELMAADGLQFRVRVPIRALAASATVARVRAALAEHFGASVGLEVEAGKVQGPTAAARAQARAAQRLAQAQAALEADPFVRTLVDDFNATIVPGSIQALEDNPDTGENHA